MNIVDTIKSFLNSDAYVSLVDEADHNNEAIKLLEHINISIASLIFFKENEIDNRVEREAHSLNKTFEYITELYEQN
jgi:hypothetical protein